MSNGEETPAEAPAAEAAPADTPEQQAVTPGTAVVSTTTVATLFSTMFATQTNTVGTIAYQWSTPQDLMAFYTDGSIMTAHFEARPIAPCVITR